MTRQVFITKDKSPFLVSIVTSYVMIRGNILRFCHCCWHNPTKAVRPHAWVDGERDEPCRRVPLRLYDPGPTSLVARRIMVPSRTRSCAPNHCGFGDA